MLQLCLAPTLKELLQTLQFLVCFHSGQGGARTTREICVKQSGPKGSDRVCSFPFFASVFFFFFVFFAGYRATYLRSAEEA